MKCKTHGNHCCAKCVLDDIKKKGDEECYKLLITLSAALVIFIVAVAIYY